VTVMFQHETVSVRNLYEISFTIYETEHEKQRWCKKLNKMHVCSSLLPETQQAAVMGLGWLIPRVFLLSTPSYHTNDQGQPIPAEGHHSYIATAMTRGHWRNYTACRYLRHRCGRRHSKWNQQSLEWAASPWQL